MPTTAHAAVLQLHAQLLILMLDQHIRLIGFFTLPVLLLLVRHLLRFDGSIWVEISRFSILNVVIRHFELRNELVLVVILRRSNVWVTVVAIVHEGVVKICIVGRHIGLVLVFRFVSGWALVHSISTVWRRSVNQLLWGVFSDDDFFLASISTHAVVIVVCGDLDSFVYSILSMIVLVFDGLRLDFDTCLVWEELLLRNVHVLLMYIILALSQVWLRSMTSVFPTTKFE